MPPVRAGVLPDAAAEGAIDMSDKMMEKERARLTELFVKYESRSDRIRRGDYTPRENAIVPPEDIDFLLLWANIGVCALEVGVPAAQQKAKEMARDART